MRVLLLHPGEMGAAVGAVLAERGHEVFWLARGRSPETAARARAAGLRESGSRRGFDLALSICPPHAALEVAGELRGAAELILDANAVSPQTAARIGAAIGPGWVDGGIVGPPPLCPGTTRLYLSGPRAAQLAPIFAGSRLEPVGLPGSAVAASALKMAYAAWTKGSAALLLAAFACARGLGVEQELLAEWARSQPGLGERLRSAAGSAAAKGWRWDGEMLEVARTFAAQELPGGFHESAAEIFRRVPREQGEELDEVLAALALPRRD